MWYIGRVFMYYNTSQEVTPVIQLIFILNKLSNLTTILIIFNLYILILTYDSFTIITIDRYENDFLDI